MRLGGVSLSPVIQMANFVGIFFLYVRDVIPFEIFAPLFMIVGIIGLSFIGMTFRKHQASTDYNTVFENQTVQANVLYQIMNAIKNKNTDDSFDDTMKYLKGIMDNGSR